jgi:hypothetical protein
MADRFESFPYPLKCLNCGHEFQKDFAGLEASPKVACPSCGVITNYDTKSARGTLDQVVKNTTDAFAKAFKKH